MFHRSAKQKAEPAFCAFPCPSGSGSQELDGHTLPLRVPSPSPRPRRAGRVPAPCVSPRPSRLMLTIQNLRKSLVRNWRPVCSAVGDAVLGAKPAPFASPLPPASGGAGPVRSLRALLWTCSDPLFCEQPAVCSGQLIFSLSLAIPQFKLVTHKSSLRLSSGHSGLVLTLSNAACFSLFRHHLLVADAGVWGTLLLGVAFRHNLCGLFILPLTVRLHSEIQKLPPDPPVRGFPGVRKLLLLRLPSRDGSPSLALLCLFLSFIFCPTSFRRQWAAFLGA